MSSAQLKLVRYSGASGIGAPAVAFSFVLASIYYSPWFDWQKNALSDLGVGSAALLFNMGLFMGGVLDGIFGMGIWFLFQKRMIGRFAGRVLVADGIFLSGIGLFPESAGRIHFIVSVGFFVLLAASVVVLGAAFAIERSKSLYLFLSLGSLVLGVVVWLVPHEGVAIPEALSGLIGACWSMFVGFGMLRRKSA